MSEEIEDTLELKRERLRQDLHISDLNHTFDNWQHHPKTEPVYQAFYKFATDDQSPPILTCYGAVGNGKTFLLEATAIALHRRGQFVRILVFRKIFEALMEALRSDETNPSSMSYSQRLDNLCCAPVLLIDDVGMGGFNSEKAMQLQFSILEAIMVHRHYERLKTAIITNIDPVEFPDRIRSRITDSNLAVLALNEGQDYRKKHINN